MDAANIMKPALARGNLSCIGATTIAEYRRYIEPDSALERRFEKVIVNEPSADETMAILRGMRPKWEEHHSAASEAASQRSKGKCQKPRRPEANPPRSYDEVKPRCEGGVVASL